MLFHFLRGIEEHPARADNEFYQAPSVIPVGAQFIGAPPMYRAMIGNACLRPVGTRGGRGEGWGPCACPGGMTSGLGSLRPTGLLPTRTSTRPPHPPRSAPCPYRMQDAPSPIRSATFIRRLGRKRPNGYDYPIRSSTFIRCLD